LLIANNSTSIGNEVRQLKKKFRSVFFLRVQVSARPVNILDSVFFFFFFLVALEFELLLGDMLIVLFPSLIFHRGFGAFLPVLTSDHDLPSYIP
jgi:hypothetical protein